MEITINFRSRVFKRAHEIARRTNKGFAVCLSKAWALYRLAKAMTKKDEVCFTYEKTDGSLRRAYGTLKDVGRFIKGTGSTSSGVFHYWDLEAVAFRCFRIENLVTVFN